ADDHVLAWRAGARTLVSGCSARMRVTATTERHFLDGRLTPEMSHVVGAAKKEFAAGRFFVACPHEARAVDRVFFPHVEERLIPVPLHRREALARLVGITGEMFRFHDRVDYADFLARMG